MSKLKKKEIPESDFDLFLKAVGSRMKEQRKKRGYDNYEDFAYDSSIARAQYGRYEKGDYDLRLSSLYRIVKSLDMTFAEFFGKGFDDK